MRTSVDFIRRYSKALRWALSLGVMALSVWLLARELDWRQVSAALADGDYGWVLAGVLAIVATFFARVWRWQALLWRSDLRFWPAMTALLVGQVANMVLPMRGGDLVRAVWVRPESGTGGSEALGSVALEKVWDLLAVLLCGLLLLALVPLPGWFSRSTWSTAAMLAVGGALLWAGLRWQDALFRWAARVLALFPAGWDAALLPRLQRLAQGLTSIQNASASARAFLWTMVNWGLGAVANWAVMRAFGVDMPVGALFLLVALMVGNAVVPTPARLGVFEGICVVSLGLFDVPYDLALAIGLVLHLVVMGPPLVAAGLLVAGVASARRGEPMNQLEYSVVVPAFQAADVVGLCVRALSEQSMDRTRYEIIVVDDGSTDDTADVAREAGADQVVCIPHGGPSVARNAGIEAARGEIVLFTDADCEPGPDWLARMTAPFTDAEVMGVKGTYRTRQTALIARLTQLEFEIRYERMADAVQHRFYRHVCGGVPARTAGAGRCI